MTFADTGFFIALLIPRDQWHEAAVRLIDPREPLVTTSHVIGETVSLLQARGYFSLALEFLDQVRADPALRIVYPDGKMQQSAWDEFKRAASSGANAVDCLSFVAMRQLGIATAHTFDRHFETAGFRIAR